MGGALAMLAFAQPAEWRLAAVVVACIAALYFIVRPQQAALKP
jgi:hypothetical protein